MPSKIKPRSVKIGDELWAQVFDYASVNGISTAEYVRQALREKMERDIRGSAAIKARTAADRKAA